MVKASDILSLIEANKTELPVSWPGADAKAVGKVAGKEEYYVIAKNGGKSTYKDKEKFRSVLRNEVNLPANMVSKLMKDLG